MEGSMTDRPPETPYSPDENGLPDCPLCGQPLTHVQINGPMEAVAAPCGCQMPPEPLLDP